MLPPGLGFNAVSERRSRWRRPSRDALLDWQEVIAINKAGAWPYRPQPICCSDSAKRSRCSRRLENIFARHKRHSAATRAAIKVWGLERNARAGRAFARADRVVVPEGHDANNSRARSSLENLDISLGAGLNEVEGESRIGHIGHFNDLMLMGALLGVEMGLDLAKVPHRGGGVLAAMEVLKGHDVVAMPKAAVA